MKRKLSSLVLATAVLLVSEVAPIALNNVKAATVQQKQTVSKEKFLVDGKSKEVWSSLVNNKRLYSSIDLAKLMSTSVIHNQKAKTFTISKLNGKKKLTLILKANSTTAVVNGKNVKLTIAPKVIGASLFVDVKPFINALGGDVITLQSGKFISTIGLLSGDTYNPQWINHSTLLVNNDNTSESSSYILNIDSKKATFKINGTDAVVSPNSKQAVYSDELGAVYLVDLIKNKVTTLNSSDITPKFQFVWSNDGTKVYFIQGDKSDAIASINISDGAISKVYSDSFTSKSDLSLSHDGKKILYSVGKEGKTSYTDPDNTDVNGIDLSNTENQLYVVDLSASELKAIQLTTTTDNKVFPAFLMNGTIVYTSYDSDGVTLPVLNVIGSDNVISPLVTDKDIATTTVTAQGKVILTVNEKTGFKTIYEVNTTSKKLTKLAQTKFEISSVSVSPDGKLLAITVPGENGEHVMVLKNGQFEEITK